MRVQNKNKTGRLKGFTIVEVLITLILTSIAITLSFSTLTYVQKLFQGYKQQNKFLNQCTGLKQRLDYEAIKSDALIEESPNKFMFKHDTSVNYLDILDKQILVKNGQHCDTFNIEAKNIKKEYELIKNPAWAGRLIKSLRFETEFTKQRFNFYFYKNYDASVKLAFDNVE